MSQVTSYCDCDFLNWSGRFHISITALVTDWKSSWGQFKNSSKIVVVQVSRTLVDYSNVESSEGNPFWLAFVDSLRKSSKGWFLWYSVRLDLSSNIWFGIKLFFFFFFFFFSDIYAVQHSNISDKVSHALYIEKIPESCWSRFLLTRLLQSWYELLLV